MVVLGAGCAHGGHAAVPAGRWLCAWWRGLFCSPDSDSYGVLISTMKWLRALSRQGAGAGCRCRVCTWWRQGAGAGAGAGRRELARRCVVLVPASGNEVITAAASDSEG